MTTKRFTCPGWPPSPHGDGCGVGFDVAPGQLVDFADESAFFDRFPDGPGCSVTAEEMAQMNGDELLCPGCALAIVAEAGAVG
jgi:hypothetical protein